MRNLFLIGHTGSQNHGCEAIIKSTADLFKNKFNIILVTFDKKHDIEYGVNEFNRIIPYKMDLNNKLIYYFVAAIAKIAKSTNIKEKYMHSSLLKAIKSGDICLNVGGDTYCYDIVPENLLFFNNYAKKRRIINILWGCSIGEDNLSDVVINDLHNYTYIFPREQLTYDLLVSKGIKPSKLVKTYDSAFALLPSDYLLPNNFKKKETIGLNISPICLNNPSLWKSIIKLIEYVLLNTDYNIAFIPHVFIGKGQQDLSVINFFKEKLEYLMDDRIVYFDDVNINCRQLKYLISNCKLLFAGRTHASIAGYSSNIPTFVFGYSAKSKGIAIDLFENDYENYLVNYQDIQNENFLVERFLFLLENYEKIVCILMKKNELISKRISFVVNQVESIDL